MKFCSIIAFFAVACVFLTCETTLLPQIIESIERTLDFYDRNIDLIEMNDIMALRLLEGQIVVADKLLRRKLHLTSKNLLLDNSRLGNIFRLAKNLTQSAAHLMVNDTRKRWRLEIPVYRWPWAIEHPYHTLDPSLKWRGINKTITKGYYQFKELCFEELVQTSASDGCILSDECIRLALKPGFILSYVVEQIAYIAIAEQNACLSEVKQHLDLGSGQTSVVEWQTELCTNALFRFSQDYKAGKGSMGKSSVDIFLKLQTFCPYLGFYQFLHADWLNEILSGQTSLGCWLGLIHSMPNPYDQEVYQSKEPDVTRKILQKPKGSNINNVDTEQKSQNEHILTSSMRQSLQKTDKSHHMKMETHHFTRPISNRSTVSSKASKSQIFFTTRSKKLDLTNRTKESTAHGLSTEDCSPSLTASSLSALSQYFRFYLLAKLSKINPDDFLHSINVILSPDVLVVVTRNVEQPHGSDSSDSSSPKTYLEQFRNVKASYGSLQNFQGVSTDTMKSSSNNSLRLRSKTGRFGKKKYTTRGDVTVIFWGEDAPMDHTYSPDGNISSEKNFDTFNDTYRGDYDDDYNSFGKNLKLLPSWQLFNQLIKHRDSSELIVKVQREMSFVDMLSYAIFVMITFLIVTLLYLSMFKSKRR